MKLDTYQVTLADGQVFWMQANLVQASGPIRANFHDPDDDEAWQTTPYQTADAQHLTFAAASLCAEYFRASEDDCVEVADVA